MGATTTVRLMTTEELLALPDDGVERYLIRGQLRVFGEPGETPTTRRGRRHTRTTTHLARLLSNWLLQRPAPRGEILTGDATFRLRREPDTVVGIDLAFMSAELAESSPDRAGIIDGWPVLAVEILSPSDRHDDVAEKVQAYLSAGVALVWVVDTDFQTVTCYRPGGRAVMFNADQELSAEPELPGFRAAVAEIFAQ